MKINIIKINIMVMMGSSTIVYTFFLSEIADQLLHNSQKQLSERAELTQHIILEMVSR